MARVASGPWSDIELREQDYGRTPLDGVVVHLQKTMIWVLMERGAATIRAMELAQRRLAGRFEYDDSHDRGGYREIVDLLREPGAGSIQ